MPTPVSDASPRDPSGAEHAEPGVGSVIGPLTAGKIAHGGHVVARHEGRVVFVRHALPGEVVTVRLTDLSQPRFWRGDVETVLEASPERVVPPCPVASLCGGCDFQHATPQMQADLKRAVVAEQLERLAGVPWDGEVERPANPVSGDPLLGWRTRVRYSVAGGVPGLLAHRSHELVPLPETGCLIAHPDGPTRDELRALAAAKGDGDLLAVVADDRSLVLTGEGRGPLVRQRLGEVDYAVAADGFWQVHPAAAQVLSETVLDFLEPKPGETALDLYCGVGLFAGQLAAHGVRVSGVEVSRDAVDLARRNVPSGRFRAAPVERALRDLPRSADLVVLDPPRAGAGAAVVGAVADRRPRAVAYVACDPAALARDLALFARRDYLLAQLRAFDLFPMTHHVECVALLQPRVLVDTPEVG